MADKNIKTEINIEFTEASSRQSLNSGDEVKSLFGKLKKWLSDLKSVAFSGSYKDLIDKPSIPTVDIDKNYRIDGTAGTSGYFKIARISITGNYINTPILLSYIQRAGKEATLYICYNLVNNIDPTLAGFRARSFRNQSIDAYIHKSAASTWDIYVKKAEAYDVLFVTDCQIRDGGTNIYFDNDQVSELPEDAIKAVSAVYLDTDGADATYLIREVTAGISDDYVVNKLTELEKEAEELREELRGLM